MQRNPRIKLISKWAIISVALLVGLTFQASAATLVQLGQHSAELSETLLGIPGMAAVASIQPAAAISGTSWGWGLAVVLLFLALFAFAFQRMTHHIKRLQTENKERDLKNL